MEIGNKIKKLTWKNKIALSILMGTLYTTTLYLFDYFFYEKTQTLLSLVSQGLFVGLFMGFGITYLNKFFGSTIKPELSENEQIEIEGPANLFKWVFGIGGKIYLTKKSFIFKSHKGNFQKGQTTIDYYNIKEVIRRKTARIVDNGIRIKTSDGKKFDIIVNERETWIEELKQRIK